MILRLFREEGPEASGICCGSGSSGLVARLPVDASESGGFSAEAEAIAFPVELGVCGAGVCGAFGGSFGWLGISFGAGDLDLALLRSTGTGAGNGVRLTVVDLALDDDDADPGVGRCGLSKGAVLAASTEVVAFVAGAEAVAFTAGAEAVAFDDDEADWPA